MSETGPKGTYFGSHKEFLRFLINHHRFNAIAEIGVLQGEASLHLLEQCSTITDYYLVDPWKEYPEDKRDPNYDYWRQDYWDRVYFEIAKKLEPYKRKTHLLRMTSAEANQLIDDESLDLVFIDAFDDYEDVYQYLTEWTPKVKKTGIIAGHDWWDEGEFAVKYEGERRAIRDFFGLENIHIGEPASNWGNAWFVWKRDWLEKSASTYFEEITVAELAQAHRLAEILIETFRPSSIMDVGCATGLYLKKFIDEGVEVGGIEIDPAAKEVAVIPKDRIWLKDITKPLTEGMRRWDLLLCLEVLEHIDEVHSEAAIDNLCALSDTIIFSAAQPGQGGSGHINCQPKDYWVELFAQRGYQFEREVSKSIADELLREVPGWNPKKDLHLWLPKNLMVFKGPATFLNEQPESDITVTITSTGRVDLLRKTVRGLMKTVGRPVKVIISDDSGNAEQQKKIKRSFGRKFDLYLHNKKRGQAWNLDFLYGKVRTPYIFHCEDDWEFLEGGYIEKSLDVLAERSDVSVVGLAKDEAFEKMGAVGECHETKGGTAYYDHPKWRIDEEHGWWHGWIGSPNLKRRADYLELGPFQQTPTEARFDKDVFGWSGMKSVWLEDKYVEHVGYGRSLFPEGEHVWVEPGLGAESEPTMPLHFISTDTYFPYTYYLGIKSALKVHNVTEIKFWATVEPEGPYFEAVRGDVTLIMLDEPEIKAIEGRDRKFRAAHIKDYLLWRILYEEGGLYMDLDTLSFRDMTYLLDDHEVVAPLRVSTLDSHPWPLESAILLAKPKSSIIESVKRFAEAKIGEHEMAWADMAYIPLSTVAMEHLDKVRVLSKQTCVPYCGGEVLYNVPLPEDAHVLHLQGSYLPKFEGFDENAVEEDDTLYAKTIRKVLTYEERHPLGEVLKLDLDEWCRLKGERMRPMFDELRSGRFLNIMEIGTFDGENALRMIRAAAERAPAGEINYYGFDLFEKAPKTELWMDFVGEIADVRRKLGLTGANIHLTKGDTKETLPQSDLPIMDFIFVDGGHSVETIRNDWEQIQRLVDGDTVVYLDDYYPEMDFVGCKFLEGRTEGYRFQLLPHIDVYERPWGQQKTQLVRTQRMLKWGQRKFRFHLLGLAHVPTHYENSMCAYSQKILKLGTMLKDLGHTVYFYGSEGSEVECDEFIQVVSHADRIKQYGDYDWRKEFFKWDTTGKDEIHQKFNRNVITAIGERAQPRDFLLCTMGTNHKPIADAVEGLTAIETGIGYHGIFADYKVFESYTHMHRLYGIRFGQGNKQYDNGGWYDVVIPNYFDPEDFPFRPEKDDYFLYIGRLIRRKGLDIACQVSRDLGKKLIVAGQGNLVNPAESLNITKENFPNVEHVGAVGPEERKELMGRAKLAFVPTYYIEPFGGVAVEIQMCGTPVLTTDWGAFIETVLHGVTGYRCRTYDDFVWAARNINNIDPQDCRDWAVKNYSMDRVKWLYEEYFRKIYDLWLEPGEAEAESGWYRTHSERKELDWLRKYYPEGAIGDGQAV